MDVLVPIAAAIVALCVLFLLRSTISLRERVARLEERDRLERELRG